MVFIHETLALTTVPTALYVRDINLARSMLRTTRHTHVFGRSVMAEFVCESVKWNSKLPNATNADPGSFAARQTMLKTKNACVALRSDHSRGTEITQRTRQTREPQWRRSTGQLNLNAIMGLAERGNHITVAATAAVFACRFNYRPSLTCNLLRYPFGTIFCAPQSQY